MGRILEYLDKIAEHPNWRTKGLKDGVLHGGARIRLPAYRRLPPRSTCLWMARADRQPLVSMPPSPALDPGSAEVALGVHRASGVRVGPQWGLRIRAPRPCADGGKIVHLDIIRFSQSPVSGGSRRALRKL